MKSTTQATTTQATTTQATTTQATTTQDNAGYRRTTKAIAGTATRSACSWLNSGIIQAGLNRVDGQAVKVAIQGLDKRSLNKTIFGRTGTVELSCNCPLSGIVDGWLYSTAKSGKCNLESINLLVETVFQAVNNSTHPKYRQLDRDGKVVATFTQVINSLGEILKGSTGTYQGKYMRSLGYSKHDIDTMTDIINPFIMVTRTGLMGARQAVKKAKK